MKKKYSILLLALVLASCNSQTESDKPIDTTKNDTSAETSNKADSTYYEVDLDDIITELSTGLKGTTLFTSGYDVLGKSEYYHDYIIGDNIYDFTTYKSADEGKATKTTVSTSGQYTPYDESAGDKAYLSIGELGLDNKIAKYYVTNGSTYLKWKDAGYYNPFSELMSSDFVKDETNPYYFNLQIDSNTSKDGLNALASSLTGQIGLEVKSFQLKTDGVTATGYDIAFNDISSSYGTMHINATGTITEKGYNLVTPIKPVSGTTIPEFDEALSKYQTLSYHVDATLSNKTIKAEVCKNGISYDYYHLNGDKYANYGYYQKGTTVQGITKIGDYYYEDGDSISNATFSQIAPTMAISSVFFTETDDSTADKRVYKFNDKYEDVVTKDSATYAILKGSVVGDLSIIIEKDKLTFRNVLIDNTTEVYTYYDLGKVEDFTLDVKEDSSSLTWSELLSNQPADLEKLYSKTIAKDYLDLIPTVGGKRSLVTLNFNAQRGDLAQILFSITDYNDGLSLISDYEATMAKNGYSETEKTSSTKDVVFEKELTVDGVSKTVSVEVILGASYFTTPTVVFYFKLK